MIESDATSRFASLDGEKYGKMSVLRSIKGESYSQGLVFDAHEIEEMNSKSEKIVECNKMTKILNGGLLVQLKIPDGSNPSQIKNTIEKASDIFDSFKPIKKIPICGNCGLKDEKLQEKCPSCKSPYIIT